MAKEKNTSTVLVIGGSGFIGTRLCRILLDRGLEVRIFDRATTPEHRELTTVGDVRNGAQLMAACAGVDSIVHLAAEHRDDVQPLSRYQEVNVDGATAVAAAAAANSVDRIVFTSSVAIYGLDKNDAAEDSVPEPFNEYGRTKLAAEEVFGTWADEDAHRSLVIVRPCVVFGEGNRGNVYNLTRQVASGRFLMVGKGNNRKSMAYVGNIVEYLADCLRAPAGKQISNFADKPDLSTRELMGVLRGCLNKPSESRLRLPLPVGLAAGHALDLAARVTGRTFPISAIRIRKFASDTTVNTDRLVASGYRPRYPLADALRLTVASEFPDRSAAAQPSGTAAASR